MCCSRLWVWAADKANRNKRQIAVAVCLFCVQIFGTGFLGHTNRAGGSPERAGCFSLNLSGEWRRLRAARTLRLRAAGAQEGRQPVVFHPLVNLPFSLRGHGEICRVETCKGAAEDFSFRVFLNRFAVPDTGLLHRRVNQRWVRHNSAAQTLNVLCWKAPTQFSGGECLNSQVPCVVTG